MALFFAICGFALYGFVLVFFAVFKVLGIHSIAMVLPLSALAGLASSVWLFRNERKSNAWFAKSVGMFVAICGLLTVVASLFYDTSFDGRWYHQEGVIQMSEGFNPYTSSLNEDSLPGGLWASNSPGMLQMSSGPLWINHYPKASEIAAASVVALLGDIEAAKVFNFILLFATGSLIYCLLRVYLGWSKLYCVLGALAIGLNPIVLAQLWTYYNDIQLYLLLLGMIGFLLVHQKDRRWEWIGMAGVMAVALVNIKFTGMVYAGAVICLYCLYDLLLRRSKETVRIGATLGLSVLFGIVAIGYSPYLRNLKDEGHPLYPIMGKHKVDIMSINMPEPFGSRGKFDKFCQSLLGRTNTFFELRDGRIPPKIPFTFHANEFTTLASPDSRVAGFGPLYGGLFLLGGIGLVWGLGRKIRDWSHAGWSQSFRWNDPVVAITFLAGSLFLIACLNPEMWWARYVPQLWVFPFLCTLGIAAVVRRAGVAPGLAVAAMLFTNLICFGVDLQSRVKETLIVERDFMFMSQSKRPVDVYFALQTGDRLKYQQRGIRFRPVTRQDSLRGPFHTTLLAGGFIGFDDTLLNDRFHDKSVSGELMKTLAQTAIQARLQRLF